MNETIFDRILRRELPAEVVYEDDTILAFKDINAQAPVHILVIPKNKWVSFNDLQEADNHKVGEFIRGVSKVAKKVTDGDGYRIVFNVGEHGQQTVNYLHAHIIGGRQLNWPPG